VYRFIHGNFLIERIRVFHGTIFNAGGTAGTLILDNIPGLFFQGDLEITNCSFQAGHFCVCQDFYVGVPADLDQFR